MVLARRLLEAGTGGSALPVPFRASGFGSQDLQAQFPPTELRQTLVTAMGVPGSCRTAAVGGEWASHEGRDEVTSRTSLMVSPAVCEAQNASKLNIFFF